MTRKEERAQYAKGYAQAYKTDLINEDIDEQRAKLYASIASSFIQKGAEWADEHPKEGLVSIGKVIDWLMQHINDYIVRGRDIDKMFDDLRKAMKE